MYDLYGFVDRFLPCSPPTSINSSGLNRDHMFYVRQDKLLFSVNLASLSMDVNWLVFATKTSHDAG